jgi:hypothetical protein
MRNGSGNDQDRRDRRRYKRTHVLMSGHLVSAKRAMKGLVLDLSVNGAQVQFAEPIATNSDLTLRLADAVDLGVEVAWHENNRLGLKFRDLPAQISSIFAGLLPEDCLVAA